MRFWHQENSFRLPVGNSARQVIPAHLIKDKKRIV